MQFLDKTCKMRSKTEHHHRILHIRNSHGAKFKLKLTILSFWTKLTQKGTFLTTQKKKKNENHHQILRILVSLGSKY